MSSRFFFLVYFFSIWPIRKISSVRLFELMDIDWFPTLCTLSFGETVQMVHSEDIFQMVGQSLFPDQMALNSNVDFNKTESIQSKTS